MGHADGEHSRQREQLMQRPWATGNEGRYTELSEGQCTVIPTGTISGNIVWDTSLPLGISSIPGFTSIKCQ